MGIGSASDTERSWKDIHDSVIDMIGCTPMVRLSRIAPELDVELLGKLEYHNPGGSLKDRIGARMLLKAEASGRIKPGDTLIEPTSGNTGIGLALAAAVKGYRVIITMPEKMSHEKQVVLEALGAEIIRTPTEAAWDAPESHIGVAKRLNEVIPNSHILDQYSNADNPDAHEEGTAVEILEQCGGELDAVVIAAGTGGTITGVAKHLKRVKPEVQIIGVDPEGSILAGPGPIHSYKVEGIGYDFLPDVFDGSLVDRWYKSNDYDSFKVARQLVRKEGLLCGGSSGSAVWAALEYAREVGPGKRIVVILPDSVRNYMTKFVDDAWMRRNGFHRSEWSMGTIGELMATMETRDIITAKVSDALGDVVDCFKKHGISQMPVLDEGKLAGILTEHDVLHCLLGGRSGRKTSVAEVVVRKVSTVAKTAPTSYLTEIFDRGEVAIVMDGDSIIGVLTKMDLIDALTRESSKAKLD